MLLSYSMLSQWPMPPVGVLGRLLKEAEEMIKLPETKTRELEEQMNLKLGCRL